MSPNGQKGTGLICFMFYVEKKGENDGRSRCYRNEENCDNKEYVLKAGEWKRQTLEFASPVSRWWNSSKSCTRTRWWGNGVCKW